MAIYTIFFTPSINTAARAETLHYAALISCRGAASAQYRIPFFNPVGEL